GLQLMAQLRLGEVGVSKELRCVEIVDVNDLSHEASPFWRFFSIIKKIFENGNCSSAQRGAFFATGSDSRLTAYYGGEGRTMYDYYFTFRSMTQAQRAVGVLQQAAIYAVLERTPRAISPQGCGYAVKVLRGDVYRAAN